MHPQRPLRNTSQVVARLILFFVKTLLYLLIALLQIEWYLINGVLQFVMSLFFENTSLSGEKIMNKVVDILSDTCRSIVSNSR